MTEINLLPCPFCGSKDVSEELNANGWPIVICDWCGAEGPQVELRRDETNALWNTRAESGRFVLHGPDSITIKDAVEINGVMVQPGTYNLSSGQV